MDDVPGTRHRADSAAYALDGARRAMRRLEATSSERAVAQSAAEASFWIAAVDEMLGGKSDASAYVQVCEREGVRDLMRALRYVRNASVHQELARVVRMGGGMTFPMTFPFRFETIPRWIDQDLPGGHEAQRSSYERALAGKDVLPTLSEAVDWLTSYTQP